MASRAAIVTGAASGIGRAIAQRLLDDGFDVLAVDLEPDQDGPGVPHAADLTTREGNRGAVDAALERFGRLDVIVPNAGFQHVAPIAEFPEDRWDGLLAVLLTSPSCSPATAGSTSPRAARAASSRSPPPTRSWPRPTRSATSRPSTA